MKKISVIIPAHNEEKYIARCICSIKAAAKFYGGDVEIIVVCNRRMPNGTCGGVRGRRIFGLLDFLGGV